MFAVGAFWALTVFGLGMMSLLVNRDVITDPRAGVGLGLAMVAAATLALVAGLLRVARLFAGGIAGVVDVFGGAAGGGDVFHLGTRGRLALSHHGNQRTHHCALLFRHSQLPVEAPKPI
jgi:hypothetical protein